MFYNTCNYKKISSGLADLLTDETGKYFWPGCTGAKPAYSMVNFRRLGWWFGGHRTGGENIQDHYT
jgi:hypothetical protein